MAFRDHTLEERAAKLLADKRALYEGTYTWVSVESADYSHLDHAFYEDTQRTLEAEGFVFLGDIESPEMRRKFPGFPKYMRVMRSDDGAISSGAYHIVHRNVFIRALNRIAARFGSDSAEMRIAHFITEWDDGTFLTTINGKMEDAPGIEVVELPFGTPVARVLAAHRDAMRRRRGDSPELRPSSAISMEQAIETGDRLDAHVREFRLAEGFTREELVSEHGEREGHQLYEAIQAIIRRERGAAPK